MDPLTAVSLAGTVVQFVDFTCKLISAGGQLYEAKELESSRVAKASAERIRLLATSSITNLQNYRLKLQAKLSTDGGDITLTRDDSLLEDICRKCTAEAEVLIARLQKLEVPIDAKHRGWQSLEMALRSVSSQKEIERMNQKLVDYRAQISSQIIVSLSERLDLITLQHSGHFQSVGRENRQIISALFSLQSTVTDNLQSQATALSRLLDRSEVVIADREDRTRKLIVDIFQDTPSSGGNSERLRSLRDEEKSLRVSVGEDILESLRFATITERFEDVAEAHRKTFQWIFRTTHVHLDQAWSDFPHWLQHEDGLYWINGKAASGKSTLMKYIFLHPDTSMHLKRWANQSGQDVPLCTAGFFFWLSGTKEQKSQVGLLRSLLHDILQQNPSLIPIVFSKQWSVRYSEKVDPMLLGSNTLVKTWLLSDLKQAIKIIVSQDQIPLKICLFIDGLDEYDGDENEIAKLFGEVSKSSNVKCCVSSRPHLVFHDAFEGQPGLRLEDLTYSDIRNYVQDDLADDERMKRLSASEPEEAGELIDEIVTSANGVFLWVKLVVASLLKGLGNRDQIADLQARLRVLPKKLEDLYVHMIKRVDESYQKEASRLYQLVAATTNSRDSDWKVVAPLSIFAISLAEESDPSLVLTAKSGFLTPEQIHSRCKATASRVISRSGGLLEIQHGNHSRNKLSPTMSVSYLHRTVKDCLERWETQAFLRDWTMSTTTDAYSPNLAIMKSYILQFKSIRDNLHDFLIREHCIDGVILYARRAEADTGSGQLELMDEYSHITSRVIRSKSSSKVLFKPTSPPTTMAVECGLHRYLRARLEADNVIEKDSAAGRALLDRAVRPRSSQEYYTQLDVISVLLEFGANPGQPWDFGWKMLHKRLQVSRTLSTEESGSQAKHWAAIIELLIQAGMTIDSTSRSVLQEEFPPQQYVQFWSNLENSSGARKKKSRRSEILDKQKCRQQ